MNRCGKDSNAAIILSMYWIVKHEHLYSDYVTPFRCQLGPVANVLDKLHSGEISNVDAKMKQMETWDHILISKSLPWRKRNC